MTMKKITLTIKDIDLLKSTQKSLLDSRILTLEQQIHLSQFLSQIPTSENFLLDKIALDELIEVHVWDMDNLQGQLEKWRRLFGNIPGYDYVSSWMVQQGEVDLLNKNVILTVDFAPSASYNASHLDGFYIYLKDDGTARFQLPTLQDAEQYPELYNFKGTWKEAYLLLIETLKKGWRMEEFPEEFERLLKK
jgi:hypothetical protein